jgi:hypothetical protein
MHAGKGATYYSIPKYSSKEISKIKYNCKANTYYIRIPEENFGWMAIS